MFQLVLLLWLGSGAACVSQSVFSVDSEPPLTSSRQQGIRIGWSERTCELPDTDQDRDGIDDRCEFALAAAFAPDLVVDPDECN